MKTLFVVRHAKSSWKNTLLADIDRPLNDRGKKDAPEMGKRLAQKNIKPDMLIASTAKRARSTAKKIAKEIGFEKKDIIRLETLYHAGVSTIFELVKQTPDHIDSLMIFGHNPGFTDFVNFIVNFQIDNIPTCGVVGITFNVNTWKNINPANSEFGFFDFPKNKKAHSKA